MSQSLVDKYRPKSFSDFIGQEELVSIFKTAIEKDNHPKAWIISGRHGLGKTSMARLYSNILLCDNLQDNYKPCGVCNSCKLIDSGNNYNVLEIDSGSNNGVKDIDKILDYCSYPPLDGKKYKIVILDECHILTSQAQAKLLKPLEDGIKNIIWIFLTTSPDSLKKPTLSRLVNVKVNLVSDSIIYNHLYNISRLENVPVLENVLSDISLKAKGHVRDAVRLLDTFISSGGVLDIGEGEEDLLDFFLLLENLQNDLNRSMSYFDAICSKYTAADVLSNLIKILSDTQKFSIIDNPNFIEFYREKLNDLLTLFKSKLNIILDFILRGYKNDISYQQIQNTLFLINGFLQDSIVDKDFDPVSSHTPPNNPLLSRETRRSLARKAGSKKDNIINAKNFALIIGAEIKKY